MITGIGIDIAETKRISKKLEKTAFRDLVFSPSEIEYCEKQARPAEHYAGRFAAKEALLKALGVGIFDKHALKDLEVISEESGKPVFNFVGEASNDPALQGMNIFLSITHVKKTACAVVVIEQV